AAPPTSPTLGSGTSPPIAASPQAETLLARSLPELESELRRLLAHARVPPSMVRQLLDGYAVSARSMNDDQRKGYLTQLILAYRKPELRLAPGEDKPLKELIALYLSMKTKNPMTDEVRRQVLDTVLKNYDESSSIAAEDRDFYKRTSVVGLIKSYAEDPGILGKPTF